LSKAHARDASSVRPMMSTSRPVMWYPATE
jgi:hypothetical protein